ncbi:MAG TPA: hypothetical protein DCG75_18895 [Bacteroidales bacterium]|nr:hypothetical protein [Bacteroidales bacterium]
MSYGDGIAKKTGKLGEAEAEKFFIENGFECYKPIPDIGVDRVLSLKKKSDKQIKIQIKGRRQPENPRWFQLTVPRAQLKEAHESKQDLNELWKQRIYMVDFWVLVSIPRNEIWVFPSKVIHEIADINFKKYFTRKDNNYNQLFYDKNLKVEKKHKELNLDIKDENGIELFKKYENFKNNISLIKEFANS